MVSIPLSSDDESTRPHGSGSAPEDSSQPVDTIQQQQQQPRKPLEQSYSLDHEHVEEKGRLIQQVFSLQNTLDDLAQRVDAVKDENVKLKSENQILGQYIENLMAASSVFQGNKGKSRVDKPTADKRKR